MSEYIFPEGTEKADPEIGDTYIYKGIELTPIEVKAGDACDYCFFQNMDDAPCGDLDNFYSRCTRKRRSDGKFVNFKKVDEEEPKIGKTYYYHGTPIIPVESSGCEGCFFSSGTLSCDADEFFDKCSSVDRSDGKPVKYKYADCELENVDDSCYKKTADAVDESVFQDYLEDNPYATLNKVLDDAYDQAAYTKGKERHATDNNFEDQVICVVQRLLFKHPFGYQAGQAIKKLIEAGRLCDLERPDEAYAEVCGAINYSAAMGHLIKEKNREE